MYKKLLFIGAIIGLVIFHLWFDNKYPSKYPTGSGVPPILQH